MQIETKLSIGDTVYIVFGDPLHTIVILSAVIHKIVIEAKEDTVYYFKNIHVEVDKSKNKDAENNSGFHKDRIGFVYEKYIDKNERPLCCMGFTNAPTFTTKKQCKEYIKQVLAGGKQKKDLRIRSDNKANLTWTFDGGKYRGENNYAFNKIVFEVKGNDLVCTFCAKRKADNREIVYKDFKNKTALQIIGNHVDDYGIHFRDGVLQVYHDLNLPLGYVEPIMRDLQD